jgi:hypothetical protein
MNQKRLAITLILMAILSVSAAQKKNIDQLHADALVKKDTGYVNVMHSLGVAHMRRSKMDSARYYYAKAFGLSKQLNYYRGLSQNADGLGSIYMYDLKHDSAINLYLQALSYADKIDENRDLYLAKARESVGVAYLALNDTVKAMNYFLQVKEVLPELNDTLLMIDLHRDFTFYYELKQDTTAAIREYKTAMQLAGQYEKSYTNDYIMTLIIDKSRLNLIENTRFFFNTPELRNEAIRYVDAMWKKRDSSEYKYIRDNVALMLATLYEASEDYPKAIEFASQAIQGGTLQEADMITLYSTLAMAYYNSNQFKEASDYLVQYHYAYADRFDKEKFSTLANLETKYQTQKKEQEILALNKQRKNQRIIIGVSILALLVALGLLLFVLRAKRLQKRLFAQEKEIQKNEMEKRMFELEQTALRAQMNPHFIFNSLNSVQRFVINNDVEGVNYYLSTFANLIRQTLENSGKQLIPLRDEVRYLDTYLRLEQMRGNEKFRYTINVNPDVDAEETYIPNMIIQPYLENSVIHGMAGKKEKEGFINLTISKNHKLTCVVEDNGVGIRASQVYKKTEESEHESMGTAITEKRIEMFNTVSREKIELEVMDKSELGGNESGTRIMIKFPINSSN